MTSTSERGSGPPVGQAIACLGALSALIGVIALPALAAGAGLMVVGTVASAAQARTPGPLLEDWWSPMAIGALAAVAGFGLTYLYEPAGELLAVGGAVTVLGAAILGSPVRSR